MTRQHASFIMRSLLLAFHALRLRLHDNLAGRALAERGLARQAPIGRLVFEMLAFSRRLVAQQLSAAHHRGRAQATLAGWRGAERTARLAKRKRAAISERTAVAVHLQKQSGGQARSRLADATTQRRPFQGAYHGSPRVVRFDARLEHRVAQHAVGRLAGHHSLRGEATE
jgi:hypothetical protein